MKTFSNLIEIPLDVETTTFNKGHPFDPRNRLISHAYSLNSTSHFEYYRYPTYTQRYISDASSSESGIVLIGFSIKFDLHWYLNCGIISLADLLVAKIWDVQQAEYLISGQTWGYASLNEVLESYGLPTKPDEVKKFWDLGIGTEDIPVEILKEYNLFDMESTYQVYKIQQQIMPEELKNLCWIDGEDLKTLIACERAGMKWDDHHAKEGLEEFKIKLGNIQRELDQYIAAVPPEFDFNWDSGDHLSAFLYGGTLAYHWSTPEERIYKSGEKKGEEYIRNTWHENHYTFGQLFKPLANSEIKKTQKNPPEALHLYQTDMPTLKQLKASTQDKKKLLALIEERAATIKVIEMFESLEKIRQDKQWQDGLIHPNYNMNAVITGRLSSNSPNMQNQPPQINKYLVSRYNSSQTPLEPMHEAFDKWPPLTPELRAQLVALEPDIAAAEMEIVSRYND